MNQSYTKEHGAPELLMPAGNMEKLKTAILFGADAVYMAGERFGLRASKTSFGEKEMQEAVDYVHSRGKKIYITLNIIAHEEDLQHLESYIYFLRDLNPDALIISDPGILATVRSLAPELEIHLSTQASTCNSASCKFWYQMGVKRIVLARELTLDEIKRIRQEIPEDMELEAFVHGAMCMAYSGRCLLSNRFTGRDANRGECAQPCRWEWKLQAQSQQQDTFFLEEDERGAYFFNSRDLCLIEHIPELAEAGINSFKVEGRMKGAFYAATVAKNYREAIDSYIADPDAYRFDPRWKEELEQMVHRTYDTGFYFTRPQEDSKVDSERSYHKEAVVCARVSRTDGQEIYLSQRNKLRLGDEVEILRPHDRNLKMTITRLWDEEHNPISSTPHAKMHFIMSRDDLIAEDKAEEIPEGSFVRRDGDKDLAKN